MTKQAPRIVSVGGGKGGVGKSVIAANIGVAMAQEGARVVIVDADLGAANQHTLFGIDRPGVTLQGLLNHEIDHLEQARMPTMVKGLSVIPGSGAVVGAANVNHGQKQRLMNEIRRLDADVVVIDVGAGVSYNVLDLFEVADVRLVVSTPQLTAVQNAYSFLKGAVHRTLRETAKTFGAVELFDAEIGKHDTDRVSQWVGQTQKVLPALAAAFAAQLDCFGVRLIGNQIFAPGEARVLKAVGRMAEDFLQLRAPVLGTFKASRAIHDSVSRRRPFLVDAVNEDAAITFRQIGMSVLTEDIAFLRSGRKPVAPGPGASVPPPAIAPVQLQQVAA